ncbi:putative mediator complex, subunit Med4 [Helianthus annuus]|nr:putative mediator complex, subunit Med4 [Helianthus annuus]
MASLTTRLFEVSPNHTQWLSSFPTFLSTKTYLQRIRILLTRKKSFLCFRLFKLNSLKPLPNFRRFLTFKTPNRKLPREIRLKDSVILAFANKLKEAERVLNILVDDYSDYRQAKRSKVDDSDESSSTTTVATRLNLTDILSYAHRISYTTFAPPEFGAGTAPLRGALPPAPQEEQMRASMLYYLADLDVGLPKSDNKDKFTIEPLVENQNDPNLLANMGIKDMLPPTLLYRRDGSLGCRCSCRRIYRSCRQLDGSPGTRLLCLRWNRFLFLLGLRNNNLNRFMFLRLQKARNPYRCDMFNWILLMTAVVNTPLMRHQMMKIDNKHHVI